jgi:hypothetical protein
MADLDAKTARALCESLEVALGRELGTKITCRDVSKQSKRWDIEALDASGAVVRLVSYTQTVPRRMAMAGAELRDVRDELEAALAGLGVRGIGISHHARALPTSRPRREALARLLAERVQRHRMSGEPIIEDPMKALLAGRHPWADPVAAAFGDVEVFATRPDSPAKVMVSSDDRLGHVVPELDEEVLPAIAEKKRRHRELTARLTLVVEPVLSSVSEATAAVVTAKLGEGHSGFMSVYVGRCVDAKFPLRRIY